jgi:PST family polysaccharide transporter
MLVFGRNLTASNFLNYFTRNFDTILIGRVLGSAPLGIYTKAYGLLLLPIGQINAPVSAVMLPSLSRLQDKPAEFRRHFLSAVRGLTLTSVPIVIFSFVFARDVVLVLLGPRWLPVAPVFQLLTPAALLGTIGFVPPWLCQALGRTERQLHYAIISAPISVAGFLVGIRWSIEGVATSFSLTFTVLFCGYLWYATKGTPVRWFDVARGFFAALGPACAAGLAGLLTRQLLVGRLIPSLTLICCAAVFTLVYTMLVLTSERSRSLVRSGLVAFRARLRS